MKVVQYRKWHRTSGIILAVFLLIQVLTGTIMAGVHLGGHEHDHDAKVEVSAGGQDAGISFSASGGEEEGLMGSLHYGGGTAGSIYRLVLGIAVLMQLGTGFMLFVKMRPGRG